MFRSSMCSSLDVTMLIGELFIVFLIIQIARNQQQCGFTSFMYRPDFDDYAFTNGKLATRTNFSLYECLGHCFLHSTCNMALYFLPAEECWLYNKSYTDVSQAVFESGSKYYAADCEAYKIPRVVCPTSSSPFPGQPVPSVQCHAQNQWVTAPADLVCSQTEWFNITEYRIMLPSGNLTGLVVDAKLVRGNTTECFLPVRTEKVLYEDIMMLRINPTDWSYVGIYNGSTWVSSKIVDPFPVPKWTTFDLNVVFSATHMQVKVNGDLFATVDNMVQTGQADARMVFGSWELPIEWVRLTYLDP